MTRNAAGSVRVLGSLRSADGVGVVRIEERFDTGIDELWSSLTDAERLARWYGTVDGDLRAGGEFRASLHASGWEGTGRVEACEPPRRFVVVSKDPDEPHEHSTEVSLAGEGDETLLVVEQIGLPLELLWAYGAGLQIHVEDLAAHIVGRDLGDAKRRFEELKRPYLDLAAGID